jgi:alpha-mannosidase
MWQGIDGTQILTHFSTVKEFGSEYASTYNSMANAKEALGTWQNFQQKELQKDLLMAYGFGDGGGGPTREMLENIEVMKNFPSLPQVKQSSVKHFFETIEPLTESKMMPVWNGELYLEYHRGTYTTQARNKRANRKSEFLMHDAEFIAAFASLHQLPISITNLPTPGAPFASTNFTTSSPARASVRYEESSSNIPNSPNVTNFAMKP